MPTRIVVKNKITQKLLLRWGADAREMVANDPERYEIHDASFEDDARNGRPARDPAALYPNIITGGDQ